MRPAMHRWLCLLLGLIIGSAEAADRAYSLSVVPQFTPTDISLRWSPLLDQLARDTGIRLELGVARDIPQFESGFLEGGPDFVYLNPYHMVMAKRAQGYLPLARGGAMLNGILVVKRDGPYQTLSDLRGKRLAFPAPNAFGASLYMRALLTEKEQVAFQSAYVGSHQNVYRHVLAGLAQAGGGVRATLDKEPPAVRERLRVLYATPDAPPHPLAAHPRVPDQVRDQLRAWLLRQAEDEGGREMLAGTGLGNILPADYARDYQALEGYRLERYAVLEGQPPR